MVRRRIFISTGEVSGDLQGSLLTEALYRQATAQGMELDISALGGDRMAAAGANLLGNTSEIGSIGLIESFPFVLPTLILQRRVIRHLRQYPPDLVVFIDYVSPNLTLSQFFKRQLPNVPIVYYIAPQEWVWSLNSRNTRMIVDITDRLLAIFPEEANYYQRQGGNVTYIGHPLVDQVQNAPSREVARSQLGLTPDALAIALVPASRRQEIKHLLPVIFEAARRLQHKLPQVQFLIPLSLEVYRTQIEAAIQHYGLNARIVSGQTLAVLAAVDLALTKSGTVNLELALLRTPQVVMYRVNAITAWVAEHVLKFSIPFMSPPNLVLMEPIVPEFLQYHATPEAILQAAMDILLNPQTRETMQRNYERMRHALGEGNVCDRAAHEILAML